MSCDAQAHNWKFGFREVKLWKWVLGAQTVCIGVAQLDVRHTSSNRKIRALHWRFVSIDIEAAQMLQQQMHFWLVVGSMANAANQYRIQRTKVTPLGTRTVERTNEIYLLGFCICIADDVDPISNDSGGACILLFEIPKSDPMLRRGDALAQL